MENREPLAQWAGPGAAAERGEMRDRRPERRWRPADGVPGGSKTCPGLRQAGAQAERRPAAHLKGFTPDPGGVSVQGSPEGERRRRLARQMTRLMISVVLMAPRR